MIIYKKLGWMISLAMISTLCLAEPMAKATPKSWTSAIKLGGNVNTGNSEDTNLNGEFNLRYEQGQWIDELTAKSQYNTGSKGVTTDKSSLAGNAQYFLGQEKINFLFANITANRDRFDPYDFVVKEVAGYGKHLVKRDDLTLSVATGPGARYSRVTATEQTRNEFIWEAIAKLNWQLNSVVSFKQEILNDFGSQNNYTQATTTLKTKLIRNLSFEAAISVQRNSQIPPESQNKKNLDTNTTFSLVYSF